MVDVQYLYDIGSRMDIDDSSDMTGNTSILVEVTGLM